MRFNYEDLCEIEGPDLLNDDDYTIIGGDDEHVPQLRLPKNVKKSTKTAETDDYSLDPELDSLLIKLNLGSKIPGTGRVKTGIWRKKARQLVACEEEPVKEDKFQRADEQNLFTTLSTGLTKNILGKLEALEKKNTERVQYVKREKQRALDLKRQAEEEQKQKAEEEARLKREGAERLRKKAELEKKQKLEEEKRQDEERKQRAAEKQKQEAAEAARKAQEEAKKGRGLTNFQQIEASFKHHKNKIKSIKTEVVEPVKKDTNLKTILGKHKRKINPKFGQLTNSEQHLRSIFSDLVALVDETKPNLLGYQWILNFIAKALVSQAETEVRVKPESALPLGTLALKLLARYPELLEFLMARFVKKCPMVIGYTCSIESEAGRYAMGWKRNQNNTWEEETSYDERMGGIATLFAIISRLPLPQDLITSQSHPLPISHSWQMLARFANTPLDLLTNTHFVVLCFWWDAAAAQFVQAYGRQAHKLLMLLTNDLTNAVAERKYVGAARLRILSEDYQSGGIIKSFPDLVA